MSLEKFKFPSSFVSSQFIKHIDSNEIKSTVETLGHTLSKQYQGQELVLIGVLKGSMIFLADLIRQLHGVKVYVDFVKMQAIGRDKESQGTISLSKDLKTNLLDKNVLIVEEIIDNGRALSFLKKRIALSAPKSLSVISLFDKPYKRGVQIEAEYIGRKIDENFIVGYGLDLEGYARNFKDIYSLKYPN